MEKAIGDLQKIAEELRTEGDRMAVDVRDGGQKSRDGFDQAMYAVHRMRRVLSLIPDRLLTVVKRLRDAS